MTILLQVKQPVKDPLLREVYRQQALHHRLHYGVEHTEEYLELPRWMAEIANQIKVDEALTVSATHSFVGFDFITSVMDSNHDMVKDIILHSPNSQFTIGGYGNLIDLKKLPNVTYFKSPEQLGDKEPGVDWSLFNGIQTIPRLKLSSGCLYKCKFCTQPHKITLVDKTKVFDEAYDIVSNLKFEYIYIDDKTFGQADNYELLYLLYNFILEYNDNFKGFVVQTTAGMFVRYGHKFEGLHIKYIELGIETNNNSILMKYNKPTNEMWNDVALSFGSQIKIIPNIMVGFPEETRETYQRTLDLLEKHINNIAFINVFPYSDYKHKADANECSLYKTFHSVQQHDDMCWMIEQLIKLNNIILRRM